MAQTLTLTLTLTLTPTPIDLTTGRRENHFEIEYVHTRVHTQPCLHVHTNLKPRYLHTHVHTYLCTYITLHNHTGYIHAVPRYNIQDTHVQTY